jgi:hypothetical protein
MIFCYWCDRKFFENEVLTIRNLSGTEIPYHGGCFAAWCDKEEVLADVMGESSPEPVEIFTRIFRAAQVAADVNHS